MRGLTWLHLILLAVLQYPLWLGRGGWLRIREVNRQLVAQHEVNDKFAARNAALDAEVHDLKLGSGAGSEAVEERARFELGLIKPDEIFVIVPSSIPSKRY